MITVCFLAVGVNGELSPEEQVDRLNLWLIVVGSTLGGLCLVLLIGLAVLAAKFTKLKKTLPSSVPNNGRGNPQNVSQIGGPSQGYPRGLARIDRPDRDPVLQFNEYPGPTQKQLTEGSIRTPFADRIATQDSRQSKIELVPMHSNGFSYTKGRSQSNESQGNRSSPFRQVSPPVVPANYYRQGNQRSLPRNDYGY